MITVFAANLACPHQCLFLTNTSGPRAPAKEPEDGVSSSGKIQAEKLGMGSGWLMADSLPVPACRAGKRFRLRLHIPKG